MPLLLKSQPGCLLCVLRNTEGPKIFINATIIGRTALNYRYCSFCSSNNIMSSQVNVRMMLNWRKGMQIHLPLQWKQQHSHSPTSPLVLHLLLLFQLEEAGLEMLTRHRGISVHLCLCECRCNVLISNCLWIRPLLLSLKSTWASLYFVITSTNFLDSTACWETK